MMGPIQSTALFIKQTGGDERSACQLEASLLDNPFKAHYQTLASQSGPTADGTTGGYVMSLLTPAQVPELSGLRKLVVKYRPSKKALGKVDVEGGGGDVAPAASVSTSHSLSRCVVQLSIACGHRAE